MMTTKAEVEENVFFSCLQQGDNFVETEADGRTTMCMDWEFWNKTKKQSCFNVQIISIESRLIKSFSTYKLPYKLCNTRCFPDKSISTCQTNCWNCDKLMIKWITELSITTESWKEPERQRKIKREKVPNCKTSSKNKSSNIQVAY